MRKLKSNSLLSLVNSYLIDASQPSNISYAWNFGSLLAVCLVIQILSGVTLAMHYNPSVAEAFNSVEHIMRDVNNGWFIRYIHSAPCDDYSGAKQVVVYYLLLLLILPSMPITAGIGMQSVDPQEFGLPLTNEMRGEVQGEVNKLDTSWRAQYSLLVLSRICRPKSFIYVQVCETGLIHDMNGVNSIELTKWCKRLNTSQQSWICKPWERTAYASDIFGSMRSRNPRISLLVKEGNLNKLYSTSASKHYKGTSGPDSPIGERPTVSVYSWLRLRIDERTKNNDELHSLIDIISEPEFLLAAYDLIKGKKGNMTPGVDKKTLDGVSWEFFVTLGLRIRKGQFNFSPSRRTTIPKAGGGKRPLSVGPPRDKITQKAIALVLETIYEPIFSDRSFGFRPKRSVHMGLKELYLKGGNYFWAINGDIAQCFPSIPHDVILELLKKRITCHRTLELIHKSLSTMTREEDGTYNKAYMGTPQGGVISPILANIALHELDTYVENYRVKYDKGKSRAVNKRYHSLNAGRHKSKNPQLRAAKLKLMRGLSPKDTQDPNFRRLLYVRYADDFVILLIGSLQEAYSLRRSLRDFLKHKLGLELNMDKTSIVNTKKGFQFLGASIKRAGKVMTKTRRRKIGNRIVRKRAERRLIINAPLNNIIEKLYKNKFVRKNHLNKVISKGRKDLVNHSHFDIIRFYNWRIRGILNFYSFAANYSSLSRIVWLLSLSCALTIALKYKLTTARKAFTRFGRNLEDPETGVSLYSEPEMKVKHDYKTDSGNVENLYSNLQGSPNGTLTNKMLDAKCAICGSANQIEMHHVRKASDIRSKIRTGNSTYLQWVGGFLRKQIPLCRYHHLLLHKGQLSHTDFQRMSRWTEPKR